MIEILEKSFLSFNIRKNLKILINLNKRNALKIRRKRMIGSKAAKSNNADGEKIHTHLLIIAEKKLACFISLIKSVEI